MPVDWVRVLRPERDRFIKGDLPSIHTVEWAIVTAKQDQGDDAKEDSGPIRGNGR